MAVWLGLSVSQGAQTQSPPTSQVTVTLTINWDNGSYNGGNSDGSLPSGEIIIDGQSYPFSCTFNYANGQGPISQNGNTAIYQTTIVAHDVDGTKTLNCSASFDSGTGSGLVSAPPISQQLTKISVSGGDTGGDTGEDSGGDSGATDEPSDNIEVHPDTNCAYLGTSHAGAIYGNNALRAVNEAYIKFRTPSDLASCEDITLIFDSAYGGWGFSFNPTDESYGGRLYLDVYKHYQYSDDLMYHDAAIFDSYIHWDKWTTSLVEHIGGTFNLSFEPGIEYVIVMRTYDGTFSFDVPVAVILDYTARGGVHVKTNGVEAKYLAYMKNGDDWDLYEPYVKNGSSWDKIGGKS